MVEATDALDALIALSSELSAVYSKANNTEGRGAFVREEPAVELIRASRGTSQRVRALFPDGVTFLRDPSVSRTVLTPSVRHYLDWNWERDAAPIVAKYRMKLIEFAGLTFGSEYRRACRKMRSEKLGHLDGFDIDADCHHELLRKLVALAVEQFDKEDVVGLLSNSNSTDPARLRRLKTALWDEADIANEQVQKTPPVETATKEQATAKNFESLPTIFDELDSSLRSRAVEVWRAAFVVRHGINNWQQWYRDLEKTGDAEPGMLWRVRERTGLALATLIQNVEPSIRQRLEELRSQLPSSPSFQNAGFDSNWDSETGMIYETPVLAWQQDPKTLATYRAGHDALLMLFGVTCEIIGRLREFPVATLDRDFVIQPSSVPSRATVLPIAAPNKPAETNNATSVDTVQGRRPNGPNATSKQAEVDEQSSPIDTAKDDRSQTGVVGHPQKSHKDKMPKLKQFQSFKRLLEGNDQASVAAEVYGDRKKQYQVARDKAAVTEYLGGRGIPQEQWKTELAKPEFVSWDNETIDVGKRRDGMSSRQRPQMDDSSEWD